MELLTDAVLDYVAKAKETADDALQMIRKSQFGQDVRYVWRHRHCIAYCIDNKNYLNYLWIQLI